MNINKTAKAKRSKRPNVLTCAQCRSNRAIILASHPPSARCADCDATYPIKTEKPHDDDDEENVQPSSRKKAVRDHGESDLPSIAPPPTARELGPLTEYITASVQGGPNALRAATKEANRLAKRFGIEFEAQWLIETPWLREWASGVLQRRANGQPASPAVNGTGKLLGASATRLRVRYAMGWRARWLTFYAMSGSKIAACRRAKVNHTTVEFHLNNDPDFARQAEVAKAHAVDLLYMRMMQRAVEGDCEPIVWQGFVVGHVMKYDSRLQIEMARALMPDRFKTPGQAPININTGDKILVMDEATRAKLMDARRKALMDMPTTQEGEAERRRAVANG